MATGWYSAPDPAIHPTPPGHPERVARVEAIQRALTPKENLVRRETPYGTREQALRVHPEEYISMLEMAVPARGWISLDADTHMAPSSLDAAWLAVGGACDAVDAVMSGDLANAFVGCRPPGHHAERTTPMGFCLLSTAAIAAKHALDEHGLSRVAVVDFDVHHGNGTQDALWDDPRALYASTHQMPLFPGTGAAHETGAHGNIMNVPLAPMTGSAEMRRAYESEIIPALLDYDPELVLISAGFDAHAADPLANLNWGSADFAWVTERLCDVAEAGAQGRVVSTLEGGYDLTALEESVAAHVSVLEERGR